MSLSPSISVDVAVIGGGTAGMRAWKAARAHTDRVVLIEEGPLGTTCAREGCMPSKLLISAADAAHHARQAWRFGADQRRMPAVDGAAVMARVRAERDRFVGFVTEEVLSWPPEARLAGRARFLDRHTLQVGEALRVQARATVLATGSRPRHLPLLEGVMERVITNAEVFEWTALPESVAVLGPGVIGLELGQALHRLGVRVRLFGVGGVVGPLSDPALLALARDTFGQELALDADARIQSVSRVQDGVEIAFLEEGGALRRERFSWVLSAVGRVPNLDRLGLEAAGVALSPRGMPAIDPLTLQVGGADMPLFVAGDATGDRPVLHEASDEGSLAGENAARFPHLPPSPSRGAAPWVSPSAIPRSSPWAAALWSSSPTARARWWWAASPSPIRAAAG